MRKQRAELEDSEQRRDRHVVEAVEAAGVGRSEIGRLLEQRHRAERQHQECQAGGAQQHQAGGEADRRRGRRREQQARDRLVPDAVLGQHADRVGAGAEERGVAERDDAGIAEREVEREREQDHGEQLGAEAEMPRKDEVEGEQQDPGDRLPPA